MGLFSSIGKALFGEKQKTTVTPTNTLSPDQQAASAELLKFLEGKGNPATQKQFTGDLVAPLSNLENLSLAALEDRSRAIGTTGDPNIRAASEALMQILNRGETDANDYIQANITDPLTDVFNETRAGTAGRFADQFFGSQRQKQDSTDFENFMDTLAATQTGARLDIRNQDTNAILEAIGLAPQLAGAEQNQLLDLLEAGSVPRENETARLLGEFEKYIQNQGQQNDLASIIAQYIGIPAQENIVRNRAGTSGLVGGFLEGAAGSFGKAAGAKIF